jgi:hypothetical protein
MADLYPGGFTNQVSFVASPYTSPSSGTRVLNWVYGLSRLTGTDLVPAITNIVKLSTNNTLTVWDSNSAMLKMNLDLATGRVSGNFVDPWFGTSNNLKGILLQSGKSIRGQYVNSGQVGSLNVDVTPFLVTQQVASVTLPALTAALSEGGLLRFEGSGSIVFTNPMMLQYDTALDANGHSVVLGGGGATRLFEVPSNLTFSALGMTFADGFGVGFNGTNGTPAQSGGDGCGAGILNLGGVVGLTNCVMTNCFVRGGDAGVDTGTNVSTTQGGRGLGAAICNRGGQLTLQGCLIADCTAIGGRGRVPSAGLVSSNATALGGALISDGGVCRVQDSTFLRNQAVGGEPLLILGEYGRAGNAAGGALAIIGGNLSIAGSRFLTNSAAGPTVSFNSGGSGQSYGGALFVETNVTALVELVTFTANSSAGGRCEQADEAGTGLGGALYNAGSVEMRGCTLEQNAALGGLSDPAGQGLGGGLASVGSLVVNGSTFNDNLAQGGEYHGAATNNIPGAAGVGGAIYAAFGSLAVTNSTFAFNRAVGGSGTPFVPAPLR